MLAEKDAKTLLTIAREAIEHHVRQLPYQPAPREEKSLVDKAGCFVTIKQEGHLRGCIGSFQSHRPLYQEVAAMAVASASKDPRFHHMEEEELGNFSLEISVLSPLEKIDSVDQIEIGRHGVYLEKNFSRGVLLPQVATDHGWDRTTFLQQTCLKAGLALDDWQSTDTDIYIFVAEVIRE
jgi:uncharacterized protein